ncbi:MAG: dihydroneopterin aldolase family protein [Candidatus Helarchaeota archaeon]
MKDKAKKYFTDEMNDRDRAIFECGITLGAIYHQFQGTPLTNDETTIHKLEEAIEATMSKQPWIENVKISIIPTDLKNGKKVYDYSELGRANFKADVIAAYGTVKVSGKIRYIEELDFPLMYIDDISAS